MTSRKRWSFFPRNEILNVVMNSNNNVQVNLSCQLLFIAFKSLCHKALVTWTKSINLEIKMESD